MVIVFTTLYSRTGIWQSATWLNRIYSQSMIRSFDMRSVGEIRQSRKGSYSDDWARCVVMGTLLSRALTVSSAVYLSSAAAWTSTVSPRPSAVRRHASMHRASLPQDNASNSFVTLDPQTNWERQTGTQTELLSPHPQYIRLETYRSQYDH